MKSKTFLWAYLFSLIAGVLLIIFSGSGAIFRSIVIALGILFLIPSVVAFVMSLIPPKKDDGTKDFKWYLIFTSSLGMAFGIMLLAIPGFFVEWIVYTLAAILIFYGIVGIVFLRAGDMPESSKLFYTTPVLTLLCGVIIIFVGPQATEKAIALLTGCFLVVFSINGFWGFLERLHLARKARKALAAAATDGENAVDDATKAIESDVKKEEDKAEKEEKKSEEADFN